jgi:cell division protein FtsW
VGADLLARKQTRLAEWRHLVVPLLPVGGLLLGLVLVGGDLGTSIVIVAILGAMLFLAGTPGRIFAIFGATALASFLVMIAIEPYRLARVTTLFNPSADPSGAGYQGLQGHYALAGGGWWGVGLGASREKWGLLPEAHTDFIFAVIGEELGLFGTLCVLGLFLLLAYAGFRGQQRPVRSARRRSRHHLVDRSGAGQHRGRYRAGAHHRHPPTADLLRGFGPGAEPRNSGHAHLLRP